MFRALLFPGWCCFLACAFAQNTINTVAGGNPPATPAAAAGASIGDPPRVATDAAGNIYFGSAHSVFRVDANGSLTRIAGTGRAGYSGDGGPATAAQFLTPTGIAVDFAGNIYVADRDAAAIRKIAPGGIISTVAGTGTPGYSGDGGPAAQGQLDLPMGLAVDASGNIFVADSGNACIRKLARDGSIATVAGNGTFGYNGDGGPATGTQLNEPEGVAVDGSGNLYIADTANDRIRQVVPNGTISTVAGNGLSAVFGSIFDETGVSTTTGDNGSATSAAVVLPTDVAVDGSGRLYVADYGNARIRTVFNTIINTLAGSPGGIPLNGIPLSGGQAAISTQLNGPTGLAVDANGNVYFAEGSIGTGSGLADGDYRVWMVTAAGILTVAAGNGLESYAGDGGSATAAQLNAPAGITTDANGNVYIADSLNHRIRRINPNGAIDTVAGNGTAGFSGDGGPALKAQLNGPMGIAVDQYGTLYIADTGNNRIRMVSVDGTMFTLAGNGNASFYGDGQPAPQASLHAPEGLVVSPIDGSIYVADTLNHRVRQITSDFVIHSVAGNGLAAFGGDGGDPLQASLNQPSGVALDAAGNLYVADRGNGRVREVSLGGVISTVAGSGSSGSGGDGSAAVNAPLANPQSVVLDGAGNLYIADVGHNALRIVAPDGTISTFAGNGACCYSGDGGPAATASLNMPWGIAIDATGDVYFTDVANNAVRVVKPTPQH
jgi:sugar lactone lactonase YvrE